MAKTSQSSEKYTPDDVLALEQSLKGFRDTLGNNPRQQELLDHLIAGAESFFNQPMREEAIIMEKDFEKAVASALSPFVDTERGKKEPFYFWIRRRG